ncbi:AtpZ/AtpI family protein [Parablautia sp. Marseille-Q6255]|uniref:AtpZ/AtpI family protein n=1 Tax=Parablautia sp. Marseille-Q6255 TaxID=3039593 RepID=UPI0024BCB8AC|nr:AtpZ/AtpI family protein [Parablautia sp. Marseille-Q6255]
MKKNANEIARSLAMITQLGVSMLAPVVLCAVVGNWLDERFGWSVTAVLLILGIMAGARNTWILVKGVIRPEAGRRLENGKDKESE